MGYRFEHKSKLLSFGEYPIVTLKMAREQRDAAKRLLAEGIDPSLHKKEVQAAKLAEKRNAFEFIAREWYETQTVDKTPGDRRRKIYMLERFCFPVLGKKNMAKIDATDILAVVKPLEQNGKVDMAHRALQYINMVYRYAIASGRVKHNIVTDIRGALRPKRPQHRASITDTEKIGRLLLDLDEFTGFYQTKCALQLIPLFFVRSTELREAVWTEFDFKERLWRIPATRMKMRMPHIVPLATQSIHILTSLREYTGRSRFVFPSVRTYERPISKSTMLNAIRFMGYRKDVLSIHGFRSMASTLLNELGYNRDWIERQLAHRERDSSRDAYNYAQYLPQRQKMMQEWADYLQGLLEKARESNQSDGINFR
jgi:integrase